MGFSISRGDKGGRSENLISRLRLISILLFGLHRLLELQPTVQPSYDKSVTMESRWYHERNGKFYDFERNLSQRYYMHHKSQTNCRTQPTALRSRQLMDLLSCSVATTSIYCGGYDQKHCDDNHRRSVNTILNLGGS